VQAAVPLCLAIGPSSRLRLIFQFHVSRFTRHVSRFTFPVPRAGTIIAITKVMTDVALSILALIAGGLTLELFAGSSRTDEDAEMPAELSGSLDEALIGNPS